MLTQKDILKFTLTVVIDCNAIVLSDDLSMQWFHNNEFIFCFVDFMKRTWRRIKLVLGNFLYFRYILHKVLNTLNVFAG